MQIEEFSLITGKSFIREMNETELSSYTAQQEINAKNVLVVYKDQRRNEYPPMADYLDGLVKGDQVQMQTYIDACLAIKAKYPKPE